MSSAFPVAATPSLAARQEIDIEAMARTLPVSHLTDKHPVSAKVRPKRRSRRPKAIMMSCSIYR